MLSELSSPLLALRTFNFHESILIGRRALQASENQMYQTKGMQTTSRAASEIIVIIKRYIRSHQSVIMERSLLSLYITTIIGSNHVTLS